MKAAVIHNFGEAPRYEDFPDPIPGEGEMLVYPKAVPLENVDKAVADGSHYSSSQMMPTLPAVAGFDGLGALEDGTIIGFGGIRSPYGAMSEKTVTRYSVPIPADIDPVLLAAATSSALTALFPLKWGAKLQPGDTVLIQGATGFAGKLAVQVARLLGAGRIIGTGRHDASLQALHELGADTVIDLKQSDEQITAAFKNAAGESGFHIVLDFLWGHPTELLIETLVPRGFSFAKHSIRLVQVGEMAGATLSLSANALRTSGLEIVGAGAGLTPEAMGDGANLVYDWMRASKLHADIEQVPLKDIESAWKRTDLHGKRLVIVP